MTHRTIEFRRLLSTLGLALALGACGGSEPAPSAPAPSATAPPAAAPAPPSTPAAGEPFGTISSRGQRVGGGTAAPSAGDGPEIIAPGARFTLPSSWVREAPSSNMRLAQARIDGDAGPAQLTVFYFGPGGGGPPDANLQRWIDQMELDADANPSRETLEYGAFRASWVEVAGTLKAGTMGMGNAQAVPDSRLLGAVVEGAGGPWFFKAIGPDATLAAARDDFLRLIQSAEAAP